MSLAARGRRARSASAGTGWAVAFLGLAALAAPGVSGCRKSGPLGPADSFLVLTPVRDGAGAPARTSSGLEIMEPVSPDDPRAEPLHKQLALGLPAEALRTDYLAKQFVRDADVGGKRYGAGPQAAAAEPTVFVVGGERPDGTTPARGLAVKGGLGRTDEHPDLLWMGLPAYPANDKALAQTLSGLLGATAAARVAGLDAPVPGTPLVRGYAQALEVVAREWKVGEPGTAMPPDVGTTRQRELFAGVRENRYAVGPNGAPRAASEILADPGLAATVLYRLAQSKSVGRKVAPPEVYAPFVKDRVPPGVSPAAVLGPFRNFQAKLLSAWGRAVLEGRPPRDIADLAEAYGRALPAEKLEAIRVFVITTYGATTKPGGVPTTPDKSSDALAELTALAAEIAAGKRDPHAAAGQR
jgi:hypothetical protein